MLQSIAAAKRSLRHRPTSGQPMSSSFPKLTLWFAALIILGYPSVSFSQSSGRITGTVTFADGKPAAGVTVLITNQTTTELYARRTDDDGKYSIRLEPGAYRITADHPHVARFDRGVERPVGRNSQRDVIVRHAGADVER